MWWGMDVWSGNSIQQPGFKNYFPTHTHTTWSIFFFLSWVTFFNGQLYSTYLYNTQWNVCPFQIKNRFHSLSFIRKPPKGTCCFRSFSGCSECQGHWLRVAPHTAGGGAPLRLWLLAERKVFESDMNLVVMKSVKHLLYLIRKHQVVFPSSCLSLHLQSYKKAGSGSVLSQLLSTWG